MSDVRDWMDGGWMHTYTGKRFYPLHPRVEDVDLRDIAHALSMICRFGGHCPTHYSVAQHCVLVSLNCDSADAAWGALHDAGEAYLGDLIRPIKHQPAMKPYRTAEADVMAVICWRFGLNPVQPASVKRADRAVLATEARDIRELSGRLDDLPPPLTEVIKPWCAERAEYAFLRRAQELGIR